MDTWDLCLFCLKPDEEVLCQKCYFDILDGIKTVVIKEKEKKKKARKRR